MRVLMTADCVGGVFVYALELARGLLQRGCEVCLAIMGPPLTAAQRHALAELPELVVRERVCALEWMDDPWAEVAASAKWLLALADAYQPHCVHLNEFAHGALPWRRPVLMVGHSCVRSWWRAVHGEEAPARYERYRAAVRAGLQSATCVVAPSAAMLGELKRDYGPFREARMIANGIDLRAFAPAAKQPHVLCSGRLWDAAKNSSAVEACAAELPWPVYIAGPQHGPNDASFKGAPCRMLGSLSRPALRAELARAAIYAAPARYEPFGLAVLEAAASGCALVLGRIPSLEENWSGAALFVDPNDHVQLGRVLRQLIDDAARREQLARSARARSRSFRADDMSEAYLALYAAITGRASRGQVSCAS